MFCCLWISSNVFVFVPRRRLFSTSSRWMHICLPCLSAKTVPVRAKGKDAANSWCVIQMPSINWKFNYSCASSSSQQTRLTKVCWPMKSCSKLLTVKASCASLRICFWCRLSWRSSWFLCRCRPSTCLKDTMEKVTSFHRNKWMETKYLLPKVRFLELRQKKWTNWTTSYNPSGLQPFLWSRVWEWELCYDLTVCKDIPLDVKSLILDIKFLIEKNKKKKKKGILLQSYT